MTNPAAQVDNLRDGVIMLGAALPAVLLFRRFGLGAVLGYLLAGVLIGPQMLHLVGDAHQPLHACARPETEDILEDRASVTHAYRSRPQSTTLHAFWDDLPGPPWLRGEQLDVAYSGLLARYPRPVPSPSKEWIDESWQIAKRYAYPPKSGSQYEITADFMEQSRDIAYRRITEAGYRLADLLRKTLRRKS